MNLKSWSTIWVRRYALLIWQCTQSHRLTYYGLGPGSRVCHIKWNSSLQNSRDLLSIDSPSGDKPSNSNNTIVLNSEALYEDPVDRLSTATRDSFWDHLTHRIETTNIARVAQRLDRKSSWPSLCSAHCFTTNFAYFAQNHPESKLNVIVLPDEITPVYIRDFNEVPVLLALALEAQVRDLCLPFVVPRARFNELLYVCSRYVMVLELL
jgi:neutral trehalase